jgi:hypothetical protein
MGQGYKHVQELEPEIKEMRRAGKTRREICTHFGLTMKQYENLINRMNRHEKRITAGILLRRKGRPRKDAQPRDLVAEQAYEIKQLKMENELLRDFLHLAGRK